MIDESEYDFGSRRVIYEEFESFIIDEFSFEEDVDRRFLIKRILEVCEEILSEKELKVFRGIFGFDGYPKNQREIADELHISKQYVNQIYFRILKKLKDNKKIKRLKRGL